MSWTVDDVPSLRGKRFVITGANSGIGFEAAKILVARHANIVLACRNQAKAEAAAEELRGIAGPDETELDVMELDNADLSSVRSFAAAFNDRFDQLDALVNNAGVMALPYGTTADGYEVQVATNHLAHFALTGLLLPRLVGTPGSRVVTVSSIAHYEGTLDLIERDGERQLDNFTFEDGEGYSPWIAYRRSKLANLMFAYELDRRLRRAGHDTASVAVHPGVSSTNLFSHYGLGWWGRILRPLVSLAFQDSAAGALPTVRAATDPSVEGGQYYGPTKRRETAGPPLLTTSSPKSHDHELAEILWTTSENLTDVRYL